MVSAHEVELASCKAQTQEVEGHMKVNAVLKRWDEAW